MRRDWYFELQEQINENEKTLRELSELEEEYQFLLQDVLDLDLTQEQREHFNTYKIKEII